MSLFIPAYERSAAEEMSPAALRDEAEIMLKKGSAPPLGGWALSPHALSVLYKLASHPDTAAEGLKLLHELQTHQVELDLQHEQLADNEREFEARLAHYQALYDFAPAAYYMLGPDGIIIASNQAGAAALGMAPGSLQDTALDNYLSADSRPAFMQLLQQLRDGIPKASCTIQIGRCDGQYWQVHASRAPDGNYLLIMAIETRDA